MPIEIRANFIFLLDIDCRIFAKQRKVINASCLMVAAHCGARNIVITDLNEYRLDFGEESCSQGYASTPLCWERHEEPLTVFLPAFQRLESGVPVDH